MKNTRWEYSVVNCDTVEFDANEIFTFSQESASKSFGFFGLGGYTVMLAGPVVDRKFESTGTWAPNDATTGWSNDLIGHGDIKLQASPAGSHWICLSDNGTGARTIRQQSVMDSYTLPAGFGFIVASGTVTADGLTAAQFAYFRPRTTDITVTGNAELLLIQ